MSMQLFIRLSRPLFLVGGFVMFALGSLSGGAITWWRYAIGQGMVTSAQITAHYVNEYADVVPDQAVQNRTWFSGGSGVLGGEGLNPAVALNAARWSTALTITMVVFVARTSVVAAALGLAAVTISWLYSLPPIRLLSTGWGEAITSSVVVGMVPIVGSLTQSGRIPGQLWIAIAALYPVHLAMMLAFELPDLSSDAAAGKRVLAARIGRRGTVAAIVSGYVAGGLVAIVGESVPLQLVVVAPLAAATVWLAPTERYQLLTTTAVATFAVAALVFIVA